MATHDLIEPPDLPALEAHSLAAGPGALELLGVRVEHPGAPIAAGAVRVEESELIGVQVSAGQAPGLVLGDVVLRDCDLSNVDAREGTLRRVEILRSRLVGFALNEGRVRDLRVTDSSLALSSFAHSRLRDAVFERVNLREASFLGATLEAVSFVDCDLGQCDFRDAKVKRCAIRGSSLNGVLGIASLRGVRMPWSDIVASAGALAGALGIELDEG
jgi:uncharacterized protein YjbI with pentapeptide repeats